MSLSSAERLRRFYQQFSTDDQVLIVIMADPDAIASAMAVKRLLWRKTARVTIASINAIKRPDNIAMIARLGIKLKPFAQIKPENYRRHVMVDSQPCHNAAFGRIRPQVIIDHHPKTDAEAEHLDIRPGYGATASIMTEYVRAAKIKPSVKLASGLFYAIKTDTSNFERQALFEDIRAFQYLFRFANTQLVGKIEQSDLKFGFLKYFSKAIESKRIRKDRVFVHLGQVANPDVCVIIADFLMRIDRVSWSFVSGLYGKKLILIFRNDGVRLNAGNLAQKCFGQFGSAGGHKSMARAEIGTGRLEGVVDVGHEKKLLRWIMSRVERKSCRS